ncbi:MAG: GntR family transcriptional regulator [Coraliomargarita sp.]
MDTPKLLGHPITRSSQINLADQIHDILCEEIHAGRWEIGEKLPSMMTLANQAQCSRMPVQQAIEQLGREGYVRQENRSGIYLKSTAPQGQPLGVMGIVLKANPKTEREMEHLGYQQMLVHRFMKFAAEHNYQTRVYYAPDDQDWKELNRVGVVFDQSVKGIVSLVPFARGDIAGLSADRIPLVFWCEPDHYSAPCVASDYEMAFYQMTNDLIRAGHKEIAPFAWPGYSPELNRTFFRGYRRAMDHSGLRVREDLYLQSLEVGKRDAFACQSFVREHEDITAYACMCTERGEQVVQSLASLGISIPQQVSVACASPDQSALPLGLKMSGVGYSPEREIEMCYDLLRQQNLTREWSIGTVLLSPFEVKGETIAKPCGSKVLAQTS